MKFVTFVRVVGVALIVLGIASTHFFLPVIGMVVALMIGIPTILATIDPR